ncbi:MAG TPA: hypothetical protein VHG09_13335, partial [Longimicrobiales bacterium]|nr:hypothetical protein [Longimicrobiales bacterium]
ALSSDGVAIGDPTRNEVRLYGSDGDLRTIVRREWTPVPVTEQEVEEARLRFINQDGEGGGPVPQRLLDQRAAITEEWVVADHMPAFSAISVDAADNIWLRNYVPNEETTGDWRASPVLPTTWTVFSSDGILLGDVELPARFLPLVFDEDVVAGIYRDESDVEYVHVYRVLKG